MYLERTVINKIKDRLGVLLCCISVLCISAQDNNQSMIPLARRVEPSTGPNIVCMEIASRPQLLS